MSGNAAVLPFVDEHAIAVAAPGTRMHVLATTRILTAVKRRAER